MTSTIKILTGGAAALFSLGTGTALGQKEPLKLITLDPGHFHAALVQKSMYAGGSPEVHVYAPGGPELRAHLALIEKYNTRAADPTHWKEIVYTGPDYLERMLREKPGNVVVIAGNNQKKAAYMEATVDAGLNVLADKPMAVTVQDFQRLQKTFAQAEKNKVLLYDMMTERYAITNILQKELAQLPEVFGRLETGTPDNPAVTKESVHHFFKYVSGAPLTRPAWYFDTEQEGEGIVDVTTHLVDLVQWECFPGVVLDYRKDIQMLSARHWPTTLTPSQFRLVTGVESYPSFLQKDVRDSLLDVYANGEMNYTIKGVHARVSVTWDFMEAPGTGDLHYAVMRGTLANLVIRQGKEQQYQPMLYIEPVNTGSDMGAYEQALRRNLQGIEQRYPGVRLKRVEKGWEVEIPEKYRTGHESQFARVMSAYLQYLREGRLPEWEKQGMIAKYYTTTQALEKARTTSAGRQWGVSAVRLGPAWKTVPSEDALRRGKDMLALDRFYRAGGENVQATPTVYRMGYSNDTLYAVFRCEEKDMPFASISHHTDWYSQLHAPTEQDASFPDKVDLFLAPDMNSAASYQFTVTKGGQQFGNKVTGPSAVSQNFTDERQPVRSEKIDGFVTKVIAEAQAWTAIIKIPWRTVGGKPSGYFGLTPIRTRWRNAEVSSPVALDFTERPAPDLYIVAGFGEETGSTAAGPSLCSLPSGILRWQRPAWLAYPDRQTLQQIWRMQQSLQHPADEQGLAQTIELTQRWIDLLVLEGFNFGKSTGSIVPEDMFPFVIRRSVNKALGEKDIPQARSLLDAWLMKLDKVSRKWFADGSPGDILESEWQVITGLQGVEKKSRVLVLHCLAGSHRVDLHLSLPETGGIRLYAEREGYFKPASLLPLNMETAAGGYLLHGRDGKVMVTKKPFGIVVYDSTGKAVMQMRGADLAFRLNDRDHMIAVDLRQPLGEKEVIYGFGEKYDHFDHHGQVFTLWGVDDWTGMTVGLLNQSYKPVPVFHSDKGYTVFVNSSYRLRADIGKTDPGQYRLSQHGPVLDYYIWPCAPEKALQSYTDLTGKPVLPPKWALEPWIGRTGRAWAGTPLHDPVEEQKRVVERFASLDIPHAAVYAEGMTAESPATHTFMEARGLHVLSWYFSSIAQKTQLKLLPGRKPAELPLLRFSDTTSSVAHSIDYIDFSHPAAKELARQFWKLRLDLGVAGSMVDFGDRVPEDAVFYDGRKGDEMHNFYAYDYHRTYSEVFRERRGSDFILFGRAAAPGSQQWTGSFAGDHRSNFTGLRAVLTGALNLSACGFSVWGSDLGGFRGWPEPAVYIRWTQFACFSPLMRCHGRTPREPWEFGDAALENYKRYAWIRENLLEYIYNSAVYSHKTGIPMMRCMAMAFPAEKQLTNVADQYLFGRHLLVAPVTTEDTGRMIAFPAGRWTGLWDNKATVGPATADIPAPLHTIPVFLDEGAVLPVKLNGDLAFGKSMTGSRVSALIITPPRQTGEETLLNDRQEHATVVMAPVKDGFTIRLNNLPETRYLLIYDAKVTQVAANGQVLPPLKGEALTTLPMGWYSTPSTGVIVIRLPCGLVRELKIDMLPLSDDGQRGTEKKL